MCSIQGSPSSSSSKSLRQTAPFLFLLCDEVLVEFKRAFPPLLTSQRWPLPGCSQRTQALLKGPRRPFWFAEELKDGLKLTCTYSQWNSGMVPFWMVTFCDLRIFLLFMYLLADPCWALVVTVSVLCGQCNALSRLMGPAAYGHKL